MENIILNIKMDDLDIYLKIEEFHFKTNWKKIWITENFADGQFIEYDKYSFAYNCKYCENYKSTPEVLLFL